MDTTSYLFSVLDKYKCQYDIAFHSTIGHIKTIISKEWEFGSYVTFYPSGSIEKGTAISISADYDLLLSISWGQTLLSQPYPEPTLEKLYTSLYDFLSKKNPSFYPRRQNVSIRIYTNGFKIDLTPARKISGNTNDHSIYISKSRSWKQTNIQKHIADVSSSNLKNEIKLLKIWREQKKLDFPSIYLEYLIIKEILHGHRRGDILLSDNFHYILKELSKSLDNGNPLSKVVIDPANTNNRLSDLISIEEKRAIQNQANWTLINPFGTNIVC